MTTAMPPIPPQTTHDAFGVITATPPARDHGTMRPAGGTVQAIAGQRNTDSKSDSPRRSTRGPRRPFYCVHADYALDAPAKSGV